MSRPVLHTRFCDLLGIEYPICLAGMGAKGGAAPPALVAAVSNAGGLGVMGGSGLETEEIRSRIREIRSLTDKPFGVDPAASRQSCRGQGDPLRGPAANKSRLSQARGVRSGPYTGIQPDGSNTRGRVRAHA